MLGFGCPSDRPKEKARGPKAPRSSKANCFAAFLVTTTSAAAATVATATATAEAAAVAMDPDVVRRVDTRWKEYWQ